jgi:glycosyltransferase involved in cell wall biosynthesis
MKIMIIAPYFYPKVGGLENYALHITKGLRKQGHDIVVVTSNHENKTYGTEKAQGLRIIRLPMLLKLSNTPIHPLWYFQLKKIIKQEKPDLINAHTPVPFMADMAARAKGKTPFVLTYHNDLVKERGLGKYLAKLFYVMFINHTLNVSDRIVATSSYYVQASAYLARYKDKVRVVSPGIDPELFNTQVDPLWLRKKFPDKKIVLFAGSMDKTHSHKGVDILIDAVAALQTKVPSIQLVAVGKGDDIARYKALAHKAGFKHEVYFPGFVSDKALARYMAGSDVFVLPSTTEAEGFGMVLIEAGACGTAVIGSTVGGIPFAVKENVTGELFKTGSATELSKVLLRILTHPSRMQAYGKAGAKHAKEYAWKAKVQDTDAVFREVVTDMAKPNVCLLHNIIPPYRLAMFEELAKQVNLTVLFCSPISKDRVWNYDLSVCKFNYELLHSRMIGPLIVNTNAWSALRRTKFDCVIANNDPDIMLTAVLAFCTAKVRRKGIVCWSEVTSNDLYYFPSLASSKNSALKLLRKTLSGAAGSYRKLCFRLADYVVFFSLGAKRFAMFANVPESKLIQTYEIMPPNLMPAPTKLRKHTALRFVYVGYLNQRKGVDYLINAFKQLSDTAAELMIVGSGPEESKLRKLARGDTRISFVGYLEGVEKANLYASADVLVLPTFHDVWGLVINEAIHYGLAVIVTEHAGAAELVNQDSGVIVPSHSVEALRGAMAVMIDDPEALVRYKTHNKGRSDVSDVAGSIAGFAQAAFAVQAKQ